MYVQEVIIDGFKSYAHRTVVNGFDPHFNAITGLNGSGKSNILDSICFVLGITNLSQVRAGNLSELVYKQGQAGVNKASVTIIFNNQDESSSPVGYEQCSEVTVTRQVLLGGKSKYLINGRVSPAGQVQNLFHSVQLNVNNPHFLIMQGRITKVLNMKPHEILGMVEETAGTRMYETKKVAAIKTIEKKQTKVDELNTILSEEITPTLERLRGEKQTYLKWSKNNADVERLERFVVANQFYTCQETLEKNSSKLTEMDTKLDECAEQVAVLETQLEDQQGHIDTLMKEQSTQIHTDLTNAKKNEEKLSKQFVKATASYNSSKSNTANAQTELTTAQSYLEEIRTSRDVKLKQLESGSDAISKAKEKATKAEAEVSRLQDVYTNMCAGLSSSSESNDDEACLPEQISKAHTDANAANARAKQAKMKYTHLSKNIKSVESQMKAEEKSSTQLNAKKTKAHQKVTQLESDIAALNFSKETFDKLNEEREECMGQCTTLQQSVDTLKAQLEGRLAFDYRDPVRGFDRSKVKGLVARLVTVQDAKYATALEVCSGGKLYNVVVEDAIVGKALLNGGQLKRRVTIIPLDKIQSRRVAQSKVLEAKDVALKLGTSAFPAVELVGFDEELRNAMEYVFGDSMVVESSDAANKICDMMKLKTITLEGDKYDPSGTISGGSKNNLGTTLERLTELRIASEQLMHIQTRYHHIEQQWQQMKPQSVSYEKLSSQLEVAKAELNAVEQHLSQTSYGMLYDKYQLMSSEMDEALKEQQTMMEEYKQKDLLYKELKAKETELTKSREEKLKGTEQAIKHAKDVATKAVKHAREVSSGAETLQLEIDDLSKEVLVAKESVEQANQALIDANTKEAEQLIQLKQIQEEYDEAKQTLVEMEQLAQNCSSELSKLTKAKTKLQHEKDAVGLEAKKLTLMKTKCQKELLQAQDICKTMLHQHAWMEHEREAFGQVGGEYDFSNVDSQEMSNRLSNLKQEQEHLSKKINKKVMGMIEKAEGEYTELIRKRKVIENDKKKIQDVIEELDIKKKTELERTWKKVNQDFGSIFSTLLPGTSAKLEPPQDMMAWEGLEVKVAFGDVWKQSLTELSGGQRSLLALSLILSLLLFKPAPMYILDEVDAALDLSHTQNIGNMLKTHFSQSQFIVVSLKEGMFNNANVIFRTKFVDGVSTVTRTIGTGASTTSGGRRTTSTTSGRAGAGALKARATNQSSATVATKSVNEEEEVDPDTSSPPAKRTNRSSRRIVGGGGKEN